MNKIMASKKIMPIEKKITKKPKVPQVEVAEDQESESNELVRINDLD